MFNGLKIKTNSINLFYLVGGATIAAATLALTAGSASAGTLTFNFGLPGNNTIITGSNYQAFNGADPTSSAPYLQAVFTDIVQGGKNAVALKLTSSLTNEKEFFSNATFNFDPSKTLTNLTISQNAANAPIDVARTTSIVTTANTVKLDGSGNQKFDIQINWETSNKKDRFNGSDVNTFLITSTENAGVSVVDFNKQQNANNTGYFAGVHIQGNGASGAVASGTPTYVPTTAPGQAVPEPLTILGAATAAGFGASFKRRLAKAKGNQKAD